MKYSYLEDIPIKVTSYNDIMKKFNLTIDFLMRPVRRKRVIQNVFIKTKENR